MTDEDLYFWGMFKNKMATRQKKEKIIACPRCGSKRIHKVTLQEPVFVDLAIPYKCEDCTYEGNSKEFDSEKEHQAFLKKLKKNA